MGEERPVIAVAGDGGLCQYLAEFTTLVKYEIRAKVIVLNNNELGKITKEQRAIGWDKWATDLVNPDFVAYATSCGGLGIAVDTKSGLDDAMRRVLSHKGPALLEIRTDPQLI